MKKIILSTACLLIWLSGFSQTAQTGINTTTPQQILHISGTPSTSTAIGTTGQFLVSPTVRVDGLNQTNNSAHPASPAISTLPLYATLNGDMVIGKKVQIIAQTLPGGTDPIPSFLKNSVSGTAVFTLQLYTINFTLLQPSLVYFNAAVSIGSIFQISAVIPTPSLNDGKARMTGIQFMLIGAGIPSNYLGSTTDSFTNLTANSGQLTPTGFFYHSLGKEVKLPAGTYTFQIFGCALANNNGFSLSFGESATDYVNIIAIAL